MDITDWLIAIGSIATAVLAYLAYQNIKLTRLNTQHERNTNSARAIMAWVRAGYEQLLHMAPNILPAKQRAHECRKLAIYASNGLEVLTEAGKLGEKVQDDVDKALKIIENLHKTLTGNDEEWFEDIRNLDAVLDQITDAEITLGHISSAIGGLKF